MSSEGPLFPEVVVDLTGQETKPVASVALVRRELQKAGHREAARRFTEEALGGPTGEIRATAARYVTLT
ncbi:MAG: hypothetical protein R3234_08625 [Thermoanaerobaculia bacterium]|nr:hypothetical protein [Thermoanaerobaculia bacterium]